MCIRDSSLHPWWLTAPLQLLARFLWENSPDIFSPIFPETAYLSPLLDVFPRALLLSAAGVGLPPATLIFAAVVYLCLQYCNL